MTHTSTEQPSALRDYDVCVIFDASRNVTVMARTPEEAAELAEDEAHGAQHLCCQCSGQLDTGDAIGSHVYEGDTEVLDSTAAGELRIELAAAKARIAELEASQARVPLSEDLENLAIGRYRVVPSHESIFHRWAVVAGDGKQQLYTGREIECMNMAQKFTGAFLDGAFVVAHSITQEKQG